MKPIFSDKATLILRQMLQSPGREWVVRDFERELGVGRGWAAKVLALLRGKGYLKGEARGRAAFAVLRNGDDLIQEWTRYYDFALNRTHAYYTADSNILPKIKRFFTQSKTDAYALTLHTGANLITNFVRTPNVYLYLHPENFKRISLELRQTLDLKELRQGGNVHLIEPYYKKSVFFGLQKIKGYPLVSNLQLYLDLYHFPERGREHADYLKRILTKKGESFAPKIEAA
ncbi:MAG: hypothetical protein HYZ84_06535 [Candidatus Omnitrophica bacterium]|nr:hypothetical protein [Candidatus Omnitrophota bacterium]